MTMDARPMKTWAVVIAGALVAGAILVVGRWDVTQGPTVLRLDRWTGDIAICYSDDSRLGHLRCGLAH